MVPKNGQLARHRVYGRVDIFDEAIDKSKIHCSPIIHPYTVQNREHLRNLFMIPSSHL